MIHTETITLNGKQYDRTYSDTYYIERDGAQYVEAVDPLNSGRVYTETDIPSARKRTDGRGSTGNHHRRCDMTEKQAKALRSVLVQGGTSLSDAIISTAPEACRRMRYDGTLIQNGTRINWNGTVKRAATDLWDTEQNNPDNAPTLWEDLNYRDGIRIIPNPITVGLKFSKDELGWWDDTLYRSKVDNNVYTPEQYIDNWELVSWLVNPEII